MAVRGFCWKKGGGVDMDRTRRERGAIRNRERVSEGQENEKCSTILLEIMRFDELRGRLEAIGMELSGGA